MATNLRTALPEDYRCQKGLLSIIHEEEAILWLWAESRLLQWEYPIVWINSPVVGKHRWPGDLWGLDSQGNLIILECKRALPADPFGDFVDFHKPTRPELSSRDLLKRWERHYWDEVSFPNSWEERPHGRTGGILPRSNKRRHIRRWKYLAQLIYNHIKSSEYTDIVKSNLGARAKRNNPPPFYAGLLVIANTNSSFLSPKGHQALLDLQRIVGPDHVNLYIAQARRLGDSQVEIFLSKNANL